MTSSDSSLSEFLLDGSHLNCEFTTPRLLLRRPAKKDAVVIQALINDKEIASNTRTIDYPYPKGAAIEWVEAQQKYWAEGKAFAFSICSLESKELMGVVGLEVQKENHNAELGYWLGRKFWSQGFCTEAARPIVEFGFEKIGLHKIFAHHVARNPASGRVLEKIGMSKEGELRGHVRKWGVFEDIVVYGLLANDKRV